MGRRGREEKKRKKESKKKKEHELLFAFGFVSQALESSTGTEYDSLESSPSIPEHNNANPNLG